MVNSEARWHCPCYSAGTLCRARGSSPGSRAVMWSPAQGGGVPSGPSEIALAVGNGTRRMTYAELAAVRGTSLASARRLVRHHHWPRQPRRACSRVTSFQPMASRFSRRPLSQQSTFWPELSSRVPDNAPPHRCEGKHRVDPRLVEKIHALTIAARE
jgi:hypothetical protein